MNTTSAADKITKCRETETQTYVVVPAESVHDLQTDETLKTPSFYLEHHYNETKTQTFIQLQIGIKQDFQKCWQTSGYVYITMSSIGFWSTSLHTSQETLGSGLSKANLVYFIYTWGILEIRTLQCYHPVDSSATSNHTPHTYIKAVKEKVTAHQIQRQANRSKHAALQTVRPLNALLVSSAVSCCQLTLSSVWHRSPSADIFVSRVLSVADDTRQLVAMWTLSTQQKHVTGQCIDGN